MRLDDVSENRALSFWWSVLSRHPEQRHAVHEADAELIPWPGTSEFLAITCDTIAEEIALGFYREPETIGWMAVTVSLSDLAAVGAEPLGLVVAVTLPSGCDEAQKAGIARGLEAACAAAGTHVLGGDTNSGRELAITATAVGRVPGATKLSRRGARAGDRVYVTGPLGAGGVLAARAVLGLPESLAREAEFRPRARLREARLLAPFASACMDTSDALVTTLDQLARVNGVGFRVEASPRELLSPEALRVADALGLDPLVFLAQPHGEFELVMTVPEAQRTPFEECCKLHGVSALRVGVATEEQVLAVAEGDRRIDGARLRDLYGSLSAEPKRYLGALLEELGRSTSR